jgi:2-polyprenyl-3-methyl-5-hydroxy-6-metoxy-1,4-benzoquinol methylase
MNDRPIFIFGQPRSGTTLLLRILNVSEGVRIYGEHGGAGHYLGLIHRALCEDHVVPYMADLSESEADALLSQGTEWCNNVGAVQTKRVRELLKGFIEALGNPFSKPGRWGFKEVHFCTLEIIKAILEFYPKAQMIFTTRHPVDCFISVKRLEWTDDANELATYWAMRNASFLQAEKDYPNNCRLIKYENLVWPNVKSLLEWLDIKPTDAHEIVHSYRVGVAPEKEVKITEKERRVLMDADVHGLYPNEFEAVYRLGGFDGAGSGVGSSPKYCWDYVTALQSFLTYHDVRSVLDVGCGDWQFSQHIDWTGIKYTGMDVVREVIDENRRKFEDVRTRFIYGDALVDELPPADLLIVKDVIHHLKHKDVQRLVDRSKDYPKVLWVVDMGVEVPHGAWPDRALCAYFKNLKSIYTFPTMPGYPYGRKEVLLAVNSESASRPKSAPVLEQV